MRPENKAERGKSPLATAILISFAIAAGAVLSTLDAPIFEEITSGKWLLIATGFLRWGRTSPASVK